MSMVLTRSPLEPIGMNGAGVSKRRSARLSAEGAEDNELPSKKSKVNVVHTESVGTKEQDGDAGAANRRKRKVYEEDRDGFSFSKGKRPKPNKAPPVQTSTAERTSPAKPAPAPQPAEDVAHKIAPKKVRRGLPATPEQTVRRSKRLSDEHAPVEHQSSPHKAAHKQSHANHERSPDSFCARPVTVEKKRKQAQNGVEEEKVMRIQLPFADTPVIKRNKEMRKASAEHGSRRSSSGMRGRRASSLIDEGRGNEASDSLLSATVVQSQSWLKSSAPATGMSTPPPSEQTIATTRVLAYKTIKQRNSANDEIPITALPHSEVPTAEFFKHISADLTEPRRMRCLLGWCGTRALPPKPEAPRESTPASNLEFQALQAARVIQEELSQALITRGVLSDWFSRDESAPPQIPLRKKPNPRNVANAAKAEEVERELERLKKERAEWDELIASAVSTSSPAKKDADPQGHLSPLHPELLDSPQRAIFEQLQAPTTATSTEPGAIQERLFNISRNLEFTIDQFAHGLHALSTTRETAERLADRSLADAANVLEQREKERKVNGKTVDPMDALKGLAKVLNSQHR